MSNEFMRKLAKSQYSIILPENIGILWRPPPKIRVLEKIKNPVAILTRRNGKIVKENRFDEILIRETNDQNKIFASHEEIAWKKLFKEHGIRGNRHTSTCKELESKILKFRVDLRGLKCRQIIASFALGYTRETIEHNYGEQRDRNRRKGERTKPILALPRQDFATSKDFLKSFQWHKLRMEALKKYGAICMCCGASPKDGSQIDVDHIKPRKTHPHLALNINNLQILCGTCNHGKGNWDQTDWRPKRPIRNAKVSIIISDDELRAVFA